MKKLKCKKCEYEWLYKGHAKYYACCPSCRSLISLRKLKEK